MIRLLLTVLEGILEAAFLYTAIKDARSASWREVVAILVICLVIFGAVYLYMRVKLA